MNCRESQNGHEAELHNEKSVFVIFVPFLVFVVEAAGFGAVE